LSIGCERLREHNVKPSSFGFDLGYRCGGWLIVGDGYDNYDGVFTQGCLGPARNTHAIVQILLTNDDGIYAPGLTAMQRELKCVGEVCVVAPATEQSGVGHSVTYLTPLICNEVFECEQHRGWAVEGSPADCVKLGMLEFCGRKPDLVVSGINSGLNAGINVLYSGTVAAAIEGAFFGVTSVAVSLEYDEHARHDRAAKIAVGIIRQILEQKGPEAQLYNLNIPASALLKKQIDVRVVPMDVARHGENFDKRKDPRGRTYYWATGEPPPPPGDRDTDLTALSQGFVTLTPLQYDMTQRDVMTAMETWRLRI
jgi:5'-nucleotidase